MRSVYGKECAKHPELAGRRYLPNSNCIGCHKEEMKVRHSRIKEDRIERDKRLDLLEAEVAFLRIAKSGDIPEIPALRAEVVNAKASALESELNLTRARRHIAILETLLHEATGK